jgi:hypothetical protein
VACVGTGLNVRPEQRSKVVRPSKSLAILCLDYTMLIALEPGHRGIIISKERTCSWGHHCQMWFASGPCLTELLETVERAVKATSTQ